MTSQFPVEVRLRQHATLGVRTSRDGEYSMNATIRNRSALRHVHHESCLAHRSIRGNKGGNCIGRSVHRGQRYLRVWDGILRTFESWTAAADRRLRMTLRAAVAVECGP